MVADAGRGICSVRAPVSAPPLAQRVKQIGPHIPLNMSTSEELARFHIETAIKLVGRDRVLVIMASIPVLPATGGAGGPTSVQKDNRGRRPGAAPDEARCQWKLTDGSQCKNAKTTDKGYCKIHAAKVDLIEL